jgi:hypothetical protein
MIEATMTHAWCFSTSYCQANLCIETKTAFSAIFHNDFIDIKVFLF